MAVLTRTDRTTLRRRPQRGSYDVEVVHSILDSGLVCHLGFSVDGRPFVIPTTYGRSGDVLYVHGAAASRTARQLASGIEVSVAITLLDGLVLARSAFHHSMNYRSVVLFGRARAVEEERSKLAALRAIVDHLAPGRWDAVRSPTPAELNATTVLALPIEEASAKIRKGPPIDSDDDLEWPVWAGELPLRLVTGPPVADQALKPPADLPEHVARYVLPGER